MKKTMIGRGIALVMALTLILCGCTAAKPDDTTSAATTEATIAQDTTAGTEAATGTQTQAEMTFFSMNMSQTMMENNYLMAYPNGDGTAYVEYVGEVKKVDTAMDAAVLETIAAAVEQAAVAQMVGQDAYEDGEASGSVYVEYADGTALSVGFSGVLPQNFIDAYAVMDTCFQSVTAEVEVYVPTPVVMGEVDDQILGEFTAILGGAGITDLDMYQIADVAKDDAFSFVMGLSSSEGIATGTSCSAMMMTTPYSMVIATLEEGTDIQSVRDDFINSLDWHKWVCVMPSDALVAQKDNMVLCLMGADTLFQTTADAIADCGWTDVETVAYTGE